MQQTCSAGHTGSISHECTFIASGADAHTQAYQRHGQKRFQETRHAPGLKSF